MTRLLVYFTTPCQLLDYVASNISMTVIYEFKVHLNGRVVFLFALRD